MPGALMFQGTGTDVGTSVLVAGLCRLLANRGVAVAPFKAVGMTDNAALAPDGAEIGRAQWLQAVAARRTPSGHMNPVLYKPAPDAPSRIVCRGTVLGCAGSDDTRAQRSRMLNAALASFRHMREQADVVLVEGAGSAAEVNLRRDDIANMGFARAANLPVVLVADIDRGGVIANLVGTHAVLDPGDRALVRGYVVNKHRGPRHLVDDAIAAISARTQWPSLGIVPMMAEPASLPAEDALDLERAAPAPSRRVKIAVPMLLRAATFDDLEPFRLDPDVTVEVVPPGRALPGDADLVVLPGTKATIADLRFLREQGWDLDIRAHVRRGGHVLGICGGYQMLGRRIRDPNGVEGRPGATETGLSLLAVETLLEPDKATRTVTAHTPDGACALDGYEIHAGRTYGPATARPMLRVPDGPEGAVSPDGRIRGCYIRGLFATDAYRRHVLAEVGHSGRTTSHLATVDDALDAIAARLDRVLDVEGLLALVRQ